MAGKILRKRKGYRNREPDWSKYTRDQLEGIASRTWRLKRQAVETVQKQSIIIEAKNEEIRRLGGRP